MSGDEATGSGRWAAIVAYAPDLLDRSRISAALPGARVVGTRAGVLAVVDERAAGAQIDDPARQDTLVLVDLGRPDALALVAELASRPVRVVAFGSHVDDERLAAAAAAGAHEVLARSVFFRRLAGFAGPD